MLFSKQIIVIGILISINLITSIGCARLSVDRRLKNYGLHNGNVHDNSAINKLEKALDDENVYVRLVAVKALGGFGERASGAVPKILLKTGDSNPVVRANSYISLHKILPNKDMTPILKTGLSDSYHGVRQEVLILIQSLQETNELLPDYSFLLALKSIRDHDTYQPCIDKANQIIQKIDIQKISLRKNQTIEKPLAESQKPVKTRKNFNHNYPIAISVIDVLGLPENTSIAINNRLYSELFKSQQFVVLERQKMEEILNEQGFQFTGCTSNECLVEMGKLLNVRLMLGGSVTKVNSLHSIDLRIIDIQSGEIISVSTEDLIGNIEEVLVTGLKNSIDKLIINLRN